MKKYAFWNNKGGTGKTSLLFQAVCHYAIRNPLERILTLDLCPQANLSELMLGGLVGEGSRRLASLQGHDSKRKSVGGYFEFRLPSPYTVPNFDPGSFLCHPREFNEYIPGNIRLLAGDPLLELQSNAIATLANTQIPGQNAWLSVADWISDFLEKLDGQIDVAFIDTNPSFSMYTQIALSASNLLVLPTMADDSSRRAIQNAFSLVHGTNLPSAIYTDYSFTQKLQSANRALPRIHLIPQNRLTQYMGPASAYASVMTEIKKFVTSTMKIHPSIFSFSDLEQGFVEVRDFQTTGVVAFAKGIPFERLSSGSHRIGEKSTQINIGYLNNCKASISELVDRL